MKSDDILTSPTQAVVQPAGETFGHFSSDGREYVMHTVHTPRPWINVLSNGRYGLVTTQTGGGFSWMENCQFFRITRWDQDLSTDLHGRYVYVQDLDQLSNIWSTTWQPTQRDADFEEVTHGLGYTVYERLIDNIRTRQTVFIAPDQPHETWLIEVTNHRSTTARLRLATWVDWWLGGQGDWHREFHRLFIETKVEGHTMLAWKHAGLPEGQREVDELPFVGFLTVTGAEVSAWCGNKMDFLGSPGRPSQPAGLVSGNPGKITGRWDDPVGSAWLEVTLAPGETRTIAVALGAAKDAEEARAIAANWTLAAAREGRRQAEEFWRDRFTTTQVHTPDEQFNALVNHWFPYQAVAGRMMARCAVYQQGGAYGFRDQLQDSLCLLASEPETTLSQLHRHAEAMYDDGGVRHWWFPDVPVYSVSHHSDTCLWLAYGLWQYLEETNDLECLAQSARFLDRRTESYGESGSLLDHALRGIDRTLHRLSPRGLPLIGAGDWNDGLSHAGIEGKGESVWVAMFLYAILKGWQPILDDVGEGALSNQFGQVAADLQAAVEAYGWDGEWYIAGTDDRGEPFGSRKNAEGKLFLNPQTWSVLSQIGVPIRQEQAMNSVRDQLIKPYGALLLSPAFSQVNPYIGYITRYAPGLRENGGVYSHAATWAIMALAEMGCHQEAYDLFRALMPCKTDAGHYQAEPYVMPGNIDGPDSPDEGKAGWTWYTGSAAWMRRVALDSIMGVRATREGLVLAPHAGGPWAQSSMRRKFRGDVYEFTFHGDGQITDPLEPLLGPGDGTAIKVEVERA